MIIAKVDKAVTQTTINKVSRCLSFQFGRTDATARAAAAPQIETAQAVKSAKRYFLPINFAISQLIAIDDRTRIGTSNNVFVPSPKI